MGLFDRFPYSNFHELNLDWILEMLNKIDKTMTEFVAINSLKYADPIQWDITSQYEKNTIVIDPQTGTAYISVAPVPVGVALTNTDYWTVVFDLGSFVVRAAKNLANTWEAETTLTATVSTPQGGWIVWNDTLYVALVNITAGDSYVIDGNIRHFTIEDIVGNMTQLLTTDKSNLVAAINEVVGGISNIITIIGDLADLTTTDKTSVVNAINELVSALSDTITDFNNIIGDLNDLNTTDKSNLVAAINELLSTLMATCGDLDDLNTTDKSNLVAAINELLSTITSTCGDLDDLNTTDKSNLVAAINEVKAQLDAFVPTDYKVVQNSNGAITNMLFVASTYMKHNSDLVYGNYQTAFSPTCTNEIDCSTFVELCLKGITYENSRYTGIQHNILGSGYYFEDEYTTEIRPESMLAGAMLKFAEEHGYAYDIDNDLDKVQVGDILFVANQPDPESTYRGIGHCAIVIGISKFNNTITVIESTTGARTIKETVWFLSGGKLLACARFPLIDCTMEVNNLIEGLYTKNKTYNVTITAGNILGGNLIHLGSNKPIEVGCPYTLVMMFDQLPANLHFGIYGTIAGTYQFMHLLGNVEHSTLCYTTFFIPENYDNVDIVGNYYGPWVRAVLNASQGSDYNENITLKWAALIKGAVVPNGHDYDFPAEDLIETNYPLSPPKTFTSWNELCTILTDSLVGALQFTIIKDQIQLTGSFNVTHDSVDITPGRYLMIGFKVTNHYGGFIMIKASGAANNDGARLFYIDNTNDTYTLRGLKFTTDV